MKAKVIIEKGIDGTFDANMEYMNDVPFGLLGQGKTVQEAMDDLSESYKEIREMYSAEGRECPELEFDFQYDVASFLQYYAYAFSLAGLERITGINQKQLGHYISGYRHPSEKTVRKIEEGVRKFSRELSSVHFA